MDSYIPKAGLWDWRYRTGQGIGGLTYGYDQGYHKSLKRWIRLGGWSFPLKSIIPSRSIRLTAPGLLPTCHSSSHIRKLYSIYDVIVPMPPYSYVVSFGDVHRYLVETWTTSSQEGIVHWTVILHNLGLFLCGSSSTHYELQGGDCMDTIAERAQSNMISVLSSSLVYPL